MARRRDDYSLLRNRIVLTVLFGYGLSLVVFFVYCLFTFPEKSFLLPFRLDWTLLQTVAYFVENLLPVHCAAVLFACSLFAPPKPSLKIRLQDAFGRLILSTVVVFIVLGAFYVALSEGILPAVHGSLGVLENRTTVARAYLSLAEQAKNDGDVKLKEAYLKYYLSVDPDNQTVIDELAALKLRPTQSSGNGQATGPQTHGRLLNLNISELFAKANAAVNEEDYYTAYYFADLARVLSPAGSQDAKRAKELAASIQEHLSSYKADAAELERQAIFKIKTQGRSDLSSDELTLVARAYYTFLHLTQKYPDDPEAARYLAEAVDKLKTMAFFRDEIERFAAMPGINRLFFVNNAVGGDTIKLAAIGGVITTENGVYARDIEAIAFGKNGEVTSSFRAPAGKIMTDGGGKLALYLVGIDRTNSSNTLFPDYSVGEPANTYSITPSMEQLELLGSEGRDIGSHYLNRLWGIWETVAPYGYPGDPIRIDALMRIGYAFTFIVLSLLALSAGWGLRPGSGFPVLSGVIMIPALPLAAYFFVRCYEYVLKLLVGSAMLAWGFTPAVIVLIAINFALVVLSIAVLASQSLGTREAAST